MQQSAEADVRLRRPKMILSSVRTFHDPIEYGDAIQGATAEMVVLGRGHFSARLTRIKLHHLWMQRCSDNLPRVGRARLDPGRTFVSFPTKPNSTQMWAGRETTWGSAYQFGMRDEIVQRSPGDAEWATMSLPVEDYLVTASTITGQDVGVPVDGLILRPSAAALSRLQNLHASASGLAEFAPKVLESAEAAHSLEQELILAMVGCTAPEVVAEDSSLLHRHREIMRRFLALIEANQNDPMYIPEICAALGISSSTLLRCCREQLGVGPQRYLWQRRMNLARHALAQSDDMRTTVTEIAMRYGFWELGRFSVAYHALFGETPLATLRRPAD
jgi:AraC-like DNA-binding protein